MTDSLVQDLQRIGLSEKEARVYLASLELGPSTAQLIAAKALVNRPTTYLMIESLIKRGLMGSFVKGKKRYFNGSLPRQLNYIFLSRKKVMEEEGHIIQKLIPALELHLNFSAEKNNTSIEILEGDNAKLAVMDLLKNSKSKEIFGLVPIDETIKYFPPRDFDGDIRNDFVKKFRTRTIVWGKNSHVLKGKDSKRSHFRKLEQLKGGSTEILILDKMILMTTFGDPMRTVVVKDPGVARSFVAMFEIFWGIAKPL